MNRKEIREYLHQKQTRQIIAAVLAVFAIALLLDLKHLKENGVSSVQRPGLGEADTQVALIVNSGDLLEDYDYDLTVSATAPSEEEAGEFFLQAEKEISESFYGNQNANEVREDLNAAESYANQAVTADWYFLPGGYVEESGALLDTQIPEDGQLIEAQVELTAGEYKELYTFSFRLFPKILTEEEALLGEIDSEIAAQEAESKQVILPQEIGEHELTWSKSTELNAWKVGLFGLLILALLYLRQLENQKTAAEKRKKAMLADYPEIVDQLAVLLGSGMNIKQAWNKISARKQIKRNKKGVDPHPGFTLMVETNYRMQDGESERNAYRSFGEEAKVAEYRKLARLLLQNLEKGSRSLAPLLELESQDAFEQRKRNVRKKGEEAGTKLLIPLILMMGIVFVIVLAPAIMNFKV